MTGLYRDVIELIDDAVGAEHQSGVYDRRISSLMELATLILVEREWLIRALDPGDQHPGGPP